MCSSKPKTPPIQPPPPPPPPPVETAERINEASRTSSQLATKRKGRGALLVQAPPTSGLSGGVPSGLSL